MFELHKYFIGFMIIVVFKIEKLDCLIDKFEFFIVLLMIDCRLFDQS